MELNNLPEAFESRIRISILAVLVRDKSKSFSELKKITGAADGNLSVHLRRLEEAGYLTSNKSFVNLKPQTMYIITIKGITDFKEYIALLEKIIKEDG